MLKLQAIGNIGNDATIKGTNGKEFASFSIATSERYKNKADQVVENTTWINCILRKDHPVIPFLKKGIKVFIEGKMTVKPFQDLKKEWRVDVSMQVQNLEILTPKPKDETNTAPDNETVSKADAVDFGSETSDDLPF